MILLALGALAMGSGARVLDDSTHRSGDSAFDVLLRSRYPGWTGFRACVDGTVSDRQECWAELHRGTRYRLLHATADVSASPPAITQLSPSTPWTRRIASVQTDAGRGTANSPQFDWEWLMRAGAPASFFDVDGDAAGMPAAIFLFHCSKDGTLVACGNSLGDAIRFTPGL